MADEKQPVAEEKQPETQRDFVDSVLLFILFVPLILALRLAALIVLSAGSAVCSWLLS